MANSSESKKVLIHNSYLQNRRDSMIAKFVKEIWPLIEDIRKITLSEPGQLKQKKQFNKITDQLAQTLNLAKWGHIKSLLQNYIFDNEEFKYMQLERAAHRFIQVREDADVNTDKEIDRIKLFYEAKGYTVGDVCYSDNYMQYGRCRVIQGKDGKVGLIRLNGLFILLPIYDSIANFSLNGGKLDGKQKDDEFFATLGEKTRVYGG